MRQTTLTFEKKLSVREANVAVLEALTRTELVYLQDIEEQIGSVMSWPGHILRLMLQQHLRFNERCTLTFWLLGNRLPPLMIVEWYMMRGMLRDRSACDHVAGLIKGHKDGQLESSGRTAYVMNATQNEKLHCDRIHPWDGIGNPADDRVQLIATPDFASDYKHNHFWDDAIAYLKNPPRQQCLTKRVRA